MGRKQLTKKAKARRGSSFIRPRKPNSLLLFGEANDYLSLFLIMEKIEFSYLVALIFSSLRFCVTFKRQLTKQTMIC